MDFRQWLIKGTGQQNNNSSLFLSGDFNISFQEYFKDKVNIDSEHIHEVESNPHMTFLYLPSPIKNIEEDKLYEICQQYLKNKTYVVTATEFRILKNVYEVRDAIIDCLVVKLKVPQELYDTRELIKQKIIDNGGKFEEIYLNYKPHMTILYFNNKHNLILPSIEEKDYTLPEITFTYGDDGEVRNF